MVDWDLKISVTLTEYEEVVTPTGLRKYNRINDLSEFVPVLKPVLTQKSGTNYFGDLGNIQP